MTSTNQCVIHCRVSTARQAYEGESLEVQHGICAEIVARNGWELAHSPWLEAYSGRKAARPVFTEILSFLDEHPGQVRYYVFRAIDRFTRGGSASYDMMKRELHKRGVELVDSMGVVQAKRNTLEDVGFEYEWSCESPSEIAEAVLATTAKAEVTTILTRMIGQEIRLTQQGYKVRQPADGFRNERVLIDGKRRVIQVPNAERAQFYIAMFELRASGTLSDADIVARVNAMGYLSRSYQRWDASHQRVIGRGGGLPLNVKRFQDIITRPIYCGVVCEKWTRGLPVRAAYDGLVSIELWNAANRGKRYLREADGRLQLLFDVNYRRQVLSKRNPEFPYRRVILCPSCRKPFMGSSSRSRNGHYVPAYHCDRAHPRVSRNKAKFENAILQFLQALEFRPADIDLVLEAMHQRFDARCHEVQHSASLMKRNADELRAQQAEAVRAFTAASGPTTRRALEAEIERLEHEIAKADIEREQLEVSRADFEEYLRDVEAVMRRPAVLLENAEDPHVQRSRFDLAFAGLPTLTEIESGTAKLSCILSLCESSRGKKSALVRPPGLTWNHIASEIIRIRQGVSESNDGATR